MLIMRPNPIGTFVDPVEAMQRLTVALKELKEYHAEYE